MNNLTATVSERDEDGSFKKSKMFGNGEIDTSTLDFFAALLMPLAREYIKTKMEEA